MIEDYEGLGQEDHWSLYGLQDFWQKEARRVNPRSPKTGKKLVAWSQVSPSQIENYVKCKRSWFFKSVARIPEPQTGRQALGTSFHLIMEKVPKGLSWPTKQDTNASDEEWDKANQLANQTLPLLPVDPQGLIKREHGIVLPTYEGGPIMKGYIDLAIPPGVGWPAFLIPRNEAVIGDYKTLSDFRYMKTPEELASSIQMMSYAKWAISEWPGGLVGASDPLPEYVRLLHIYARTKAPFGRSSIRHESALVSVPEINVFWDKTLDIVREMQSTATCQSADDVEANGALTGHCEAYGGCHFRDKCGLAKESGIKALFQIGKKPASNPPTTSTEDMSGSPILQKILAARAAAQGTTQTNQAQTEQGQASPTPAPEAAFPSPPAVVSNEARSNSALTLGGTNVSSFGETGTVATVGTIPSKGPISGLMAKIEATGKGTPQLTGSVDQAFRKEVGYGCGPSGELGKTVVSSVGDLMKLAQGIIPPDAPPRTQAVITTPGTPVADPEAEPTSTEEGEEESDESVSTTTNVVESTPTASTTLPVSQSQTQAAVTQETKKRGRPSKEEMAAREAAEKAKFEAVVAAEVQKRLAASGSALVTQHEAGVVAVERPDAALAEAHEALRDAHKDINALKAELDRVKNQSPGGGRSEGLTIYVDTIATKGDPEVTDFYDWLRPATMSVEEKNNVADWRQINYVGKGLLAAELRELIKLQGLPKAIQIPSFAAGADVALEILSPLAKRIIRPLR